jgi:hypothetical protein
MYNNEFGGMNFPMNDPNNMYNNNQGDQGQGSSMFLDPNNVNLNNNMNNMNSMSYFGVPNNNQNSNLNNK